MNKDYNCGITPEHITTLKPNEIFVFGSNLQGMHGGGAARLALDRFGAQLGLGVGIQGQSYAIPTMHGGVDKIRPYVDQFVEYARTHPDKHFLVTKIGCGIAGFRTDEIAPLFKDAVWMANVSLPIEFIRYNTADDIDEIGWDADKFLSDYHRVIKDRSRYNEVKQLRVNEYLNTIALVKQGYYHNNRGERVSLKYDKAMNAVLYNREIHNPPQAADAYTDMTVEVVNDDCLAVAIRLKEEGYNPATLNMASRRNPGGGVTNGAGAQEETLFRRSNLYQSLYQFADYAGQYGLPKRPIGYPLDPNFGGIYTPSALIFREDEAHGFALMDQPVPMAFITVAGMNRPDLEDAQTIASYHVKPIKNKIRTILRIGVRHGHDALVLGALGCGAFCNPPKHVARLFREVLEENEFRHAFRKIVFAILDDHNTRKAHNPEGNFKPFVDEFKSPL